MILEATQVIQLMPIHKMQQVLEMQHQQTLIHKMQQVLEMQHQLMLTHRMQLVLKI